MKANGFAITQEFVDVETAKQAGRSGFGQMIAFLKKHPTCRTILVEKPIAYTETCATGSPLTSSARTSIS